MILILISYYSPSSVSNRWSSPAFFICWTLFCWYFVHPWTYFFWFLATNSSFWSTQAFFVALDILYLLDCSFLVGFALIFSYCSEHRFFLPHKLSYCFPMLVHHFSLVSFILLVPLSDFSISYSIMWFSLLLGFFWWLLLLLLLLLILFIFYPCCYP